MHVFVNQLSCYLWLPAALLPLGSGEYIGNRKTGLLIKESFWLNLSRCMIFLIV